MAAVARQRYHAVERLRKLEAENRELRAALEYERRMRTAEIAAAERRGPVVAGRRQRCVETAASKLAKSISSTVAL